MKYSDGMPSWPCCATEQVTPHDVSDVGGVRYVTATFGVVKTYVLTAIGYETTTNCNRTVVVMTKVWRLMQSIRMYVAVLEVMVTVSARGAMM